MRIYNEALCKQLITVSEAIEVIRNVFSIGQDVDHHMMPKTYLDINKDGNLHGDFRAMPARMGNISGIKWVSVFPENNSQPVVIGTILLNSSETGELLAVLNGTYITNIRTAAAAAVASEKLSRKGSKVAAFIGCGGQTMLHVEAINSVIPTLDTFVFYDLDQQRAESMANRWHESTGHKSLVANCPELCVKDADILTTLTPSREPIVQGEWLKQGVHINAMGSDARGKREFDNETYNRVDLWTYDDIIQASHSGETQHVSSSKVSEANYIGAVDPIIKARIALWQLTLGEVASQYFDTQITLFDSTGIALQDIAVASWIYQKDIEFDYTEGSQHGHV